MKEGKLTLPVIYVANKNPEAHALALKVRAGEATQEEIATNRHYLQEPLFLNIKVPVPSLEQQNKLVETIFFFFY